MPVPFRFLAQDIERVIATSDNDGGIVQMPYGAGVFNLPVVDTVLRPTRVAAAFGRMESVVITSAGRSAEVAEAAAAAANEPTFDFETLEPTRISSYARINNVQLLQAPQTAPSVAGYLRAGVEARVEEAALVGTGAGGQLTGLTSTPSGIGQGANGAAVVTYDTGAGLLGGLVDGKHAGDVSQISAVTTVAGYQKLATTFPHEWGDVGAGHFAVERDGFPRQRLPAYAFRESAAGLRQAGFDRQCDDSGGLGRWSVVAEIRDEPVFGRPDRPGSESVLLHRLPEGQRRRDCRVQGQDRLMFWRRKPKDVERAVAQTPAYLTGASDPLTTVRSTGLAAVEMAAGLLGRALAGAEVKGIPAGMLDPQLRLLIGRNLIWHGRSLLFLDYDGGMELVPAYGDVVRGRGARSSWLYDLQPFAPDGQFTIRLVPRSMVADCMWSPNPQVPWQAVSPLEIAEVNLYANIVGGASVEASAPRGFLLPLRDEGTLMSGAPGEEAAQGVRASVIGLLEAMQKGLAVVNSSYFEFGTSEHRQGVAARMGLDIPSATVELERMVCRVVAEACGVPTRMLGGQTPDPDAMSVFIDATVRPIAESLAAEVGRVLETEVGLELRAGRTGRWWQDRARALANLVKAGVPVEQAQRITGLAA